nr:MAG TPA: hypothetical protein [Bacteriophage sp.]
MLFSCFCKCTTLRFLYMDIFARIIIRSNRITSSNCWDYSISKIIKIKIIPL